MDSPRMLIEITTRKLLKLVPMRPKRTSSTKSTSTAADTIFQKRKEVFELSESEEEDDDDEFVGSAAEVDDSESEEPETEANAQVSEEDRESNENEEQKAAPGKRRVSQSKKPSKKKATTDIRIKGEAEDLEEDDVRSENDNGSDTNGEEPELALKEDHALRPIFAKGNGRLFLETFSPIAEQAIDFLVAVAEPVSRPALMHEYIMTEYSLYAAVSVGIPTDSIISVLGKLCKTQLPPQLIDFIRLHTKSYGKVKLVLKDNHMFVESAFPEVLRTLLQDEIISDARIVPDEPVDEDTVEGFSTRVQTFEPVNFARPSGLASANKRRNGSGNEASEHLHGIAPAYISSRPASLLHNANPPVAPEQVQPPNMLASAEDEFIDLFDDDPFCLEDDPFANMDPAEMEKLNRILDGHAPRTPLDEPLFEAYALEEDILVADTVPSLPIGVDLAPAVTLAELDNEATQSALPSDLANLDIRGITDPSFNKSNPNAATTALLSTFEISREKSEHVRKACSAKGFPILEEYDFRNDSTLPQLDLCLKPAAILRPYQEKCLNKMFGNGRARSGIIVLPCGAGKTLVGVTAACTVKKRVLVLCTSAVSVEQWAREFKSWTNIKEIEIAKFTSNHKELLPNDNGVLISTYTMVTFSSKRAYDAQKMMDYIKSREWGLLILDEVHVVPADMFRKVLTIVGAQSKLGLTATLVREDDKIANLNYLIGPKLYEANWMDLAKKGHIANVKCSEVWCTMTKEFYKEYLGQSSRKRQLLYVMNPNKIQACQYLIDYHEQRGDKVIVFSDNVFALKHYATKLNRPYIYGGSSTADRLRTLQQFKYNPTLNTIFLSKVGDTSIDIPEASCLIQISSHYGSRRQEAQRLGRILRAKKNSYGSGGDGGYNSFFYTLVSRDTEEVFYCAKRQQFLIDQGYSYDIITRMEGMETVTPLVYATISQRLELLATILVSNDMIGLDELERDEDTLEEDDWGGSASSFVETRSGQPSSAGGGGRTYMFAQSVASMKSLSGADNMAYIEQNRGGLSAEFRRKRQ